jgi:hypothetical protein
MKLHVMTYNVHGLNMEEDTCKLSYYFKGIHPRLDIIVLQKHELRGNKVKKVGELLWKEVSSWIIEAKEGYTSEMQHGQINKGGSCVWLDPKWAKLVS